MVSIGSASLAAWYPRSFLREAFDLRLLHKVSCVLFTWNYFVSFFLFT